MVALGVRGWRTWSWSALHDYVQCVAAGLQASGVTGGDLGLLAASPGPRTLVLELALRSIGALPVWIDEESLSPSTITGMGPGRVGVLVLDHGESGGDAAVADSAPRATVITGDDLGWTRLVDLGRDRLANDPEAVVLADRLASAYESRPRVRRSDGVLTWREASGFSDGWLLTAKDRVVLQAQPGDGFAGDVIEATLRSGASLCWIGDRSALELTLLEVKPTVLALEADTASALESLIGGANVEEQPWHVDPTGVLNCVAIVSAGGRPPLGARRMAAEIEDLRPWLGEALSQIVLAAEPGNVSRAVAAALGVDLEVQALSPAGLAPLPARARRGLDQVTTLPRRRKSPVDPDFSVPGGNRPARRVTQPAVGVTAAAASQPAWSPLARGESALDRVLARQRDAGASIVPTASAG